MIESEIKVSLEGIDMDKLIGRITRFGFTHKEKKREIDIYYNGAGERDFRQTDEALRIRKVEMLGAEVQDSAADEDRSFITYKGPKMDAGTMTRLELQTGVDDGDTADAIVKALGFSPVFTVDKTRDEYWNRDLLKDPELSRNWNPVTKHAVTLCIDDVRGLGMFLEIEIMLRDAKGAGAAKANLHQLMDVLQLPQDKATTVSYLEQLMTAR